MTNEGIQLLKAGALKISVTLSDHAIVIGEMLSPIVLCSLGRFYDQLQIEVFQFGALNPLNVIGSGQKIHWIDEDTATIPISTESLAPGFYEIRMVIFHTPTGDAPAERLDFFPPEHFPPVIFQAVENTSEKRAKCEIYNQAELLYRMCNSELLTPIDIRYEKTIDQQLYRSFVFVRNVLLGTQVRGLGFEIQPIPGGVGSQDEVDFLNQFFESQNLSFVIFDYQDEIRDRAVQGQPTCVVHFPNIISSNIDEVHKYSVDFAADVNLSLSLSRNAAPQTFATVIVDQREMASYLYLEHPNYRGNLVTGQLSGEFAASILNDISVVRADGYKRFIASLFIEFLRDRDDDFSFVRITQIFEVIVGDKCFDTNDMLVDYNGTAIVEDGKPVQTTSSNAARVFSLLRRLPVRLSESTWIDINTCFSARHAIVHCGGISNFERLSNIKAKRYIRSAINDLDGESSLKQIRRRLESIVELLVRMEMRY